MKRLFSLLLAITVVLGCAAKSSKKTTPVVAPTGHGVVSQVWYPTSSGDSRRLSIYLPPSYQSGKDYYPVLYLLHGTYGDELSWLTQGNAAQILDSLIMAGKCKQMIVVMPNGNMWQKEASQEPWDFNDNGATTTKMMDGRFEERFGDIMNFVERNYRTVTKKHSRAIAGLSRGGYHAMHISHYYNQFFDYVGLFSATYAYKDRKEAIASGILFPEADSETPRVYRNIEKDLKRQFQTAPQLYWIGIGKDDFLYKENVIYRQLLTQSNIKFTYHESAGGHEWQNWQDYLTIFLQLIF